MSEWISVDERLPPALVSVLVISRGFIDVAYHEFNAWWAGPSDDRLWDITHWQPLPEPPIDNISAKCL